ncbi:MAG TPA: topology modulation protein [Bacillales bacterium]|nr:topology modulation protein [Bacillales bacterium]
MRRIMVVGVSPGVGKSTFACQLGEKLDFPVVHLDSLYWEPGWVETPIETFEEAQRQAVANESWVIDGNYSGTFPIRLERADAILYLERPLAVCLYRVLKRWFRNRGTIRPDVGAGCYEKVDADFLKFICSTYASRKKKMRQLLQSYESEKTVRRLGSQREIDDFLAALKKPSD